jgi:hypothetical protein
MRNILLCLVMAVACAGSVSAAGTKDPVQDSIGTLNQYTAERDANGYSYFWPVALYIGIGWILCPILFGVMAMKPGTRAIGIILLLLWGIFFAAPRILEFVALFVVLPCMIAGGLFKGAIKQLK